MTAESAAALYDANPDTKRDDLDHEIIRRVIRRHLFEVKECYEPELLKNPQLGGTIRVGFTIDAIGEVLKSALKGSTMNNQQVETCLVAAVRGWTFPALAHGGVLRVEYPFKLSPAPRRDAA